MRFATGKLDYALTKPEDSQVLVSVREVQIWQLVDVVSGSIVVGIGVSRLEANVGVSDALGFVVLLFLGAVVLYCVWLVLATGAFWIVRMWFLTELFEGVYQTGRFPIGVYPGWLRYSMTYLCRSASPSPCPRRRSPHVWPGRPSSPQWSSPQHCSRSPAGSGASVCATTRARRPSQT